MATFLAAALPYLLSSGEAATAAGGLSGFGGLANALGGGLGGLGSMAGSTMAGGMMGPTQGSGLLGALSGGGMNGLGNSISLMSGMMPHKSPSSENGLVLTNPAANIKLVGSNPSTRY